MKKNEFALLILIVGVTALLSYWVVNSLISDLKPKPVSLPKASAISSEVVTPSPAIFNKASGINPTVKITIGGQSGQQPFNDAPTR